MNSSNKSSLYTLLLIPCVAVALIFVADKMLFGEPTPINAAALTQVGGQILDSAESLPRFQFQQPQGPAPQPVNVFVNQPAQQGPDLEQVQFYTDAQGVQWVWVNGWYPCSRVIELSVTVGISEQRRQHVLVGCGLQ